MTRLSPSQHRAIEKRREPIRHAMDRLQERHFPNLDDDAAEELVVMMGKLCELAATTGGKTGKVVNIESDTSVIIDLDIFTDRKKIRVCYNPVDRVIRTVFPEVKE